MFYDEPKCQSLILKQKNWNWSASDCVDTNEYQNELLQFIKEATASSTKLPYLKPFEIIKKSKIETSSADRLSENTHTHLVDNKKLKRNHRQVLITSLHSMSPYAKKIEIYDFISFLLIMILWLKPVVNYKAKTKWSSKGGVSQKSKETKYQMEPESEFKARAHFSTNNLVSYKIDHAIDLQIF